MKKQHVTGLALRYFTITTPCEYCEEPLYTNNPQKKKHSSCLRKSKADYTRNWLREKNNER